MIERRKRINFIRRRYTATTAAANITVNKLNRSFLMKVSCKRYHTQALNSLINIRIKSTFKVLQQLHKKYRSISVIREKKSSVSF